MKSVLTIGYGRALFDEKSSERKRLATCARIVDGLHMIVFSKRSHECVSVRAGSLCIYPTHSRSRLHMLFDAYKIGRSLLRASGAKKDLWIISTQDPFEAGLVGYVLHLRYGIALQVQEHGDFFGGVWWRRERWSNQLRYVFGKWLLRRADCVRVVSSRVAKHLVAIGVDFARITTLAVASDLVAFAKRDTIDSAHNLHARYPDATAIVLAVGRLVQEKNFALLIRAFKQVVRGHTKAQLVIVGSGPEEGELMKLVEMFDLSARVSFIPWTDDVASYMRSADIFALCSYREGWARVIIEAMTAGLSAVVTDVGCVGEVFVHERHGIVVPVADSDALAEALQRLIVDPPRRRKLGETAARDIAISRATQQPYAEAWLATIEACGKVENTYKRSSSLKS